MIGIRPGGHRVLLGALAWYGVFTLLYSLIQHPRVMESLQGLLTFVGSVTSYRWSNRLLLLLVVTWGLIISVIASWAGVRVMEGSRSSFQTKLLAWLCWSAVGVLILEVLFIFQFEHQEYRFRPSTLANWLVVVLAESLTTALIALGGGWLYDRMNGFFTTRTEERRIDPAH